MKTPTASVLAAAAVLFSSTGIALAQDAVQWTEAEGGNGHWYAVVPVSETCFDEIRSVALGLGGDLASVESQQENDVILERIEALDFDPDRSVIGLVPLKGESEDDPGNWYWVDGAQGSYRNWSSSTQEPQDYPGTLYEPLASLEAGLDGRWADVPCGSSTPHVAVIEWSADCNKDGIVDYGQILDGTFSDDNDNGIPDCCEDGTCLAPVQWRTEDGGNGHWYEVVGMGDTLCWEDASAFANSQGGYLATPVTFEEDMILKSLLQGIEYGTGTYIGGFQNVDSPDYSEPSGGWEWVSGEPWSYQNWHPGEPVNSYGGEDFLAADFNGPTYGWFDIGGPDAPQGPCNKSVLAIEYSADCNNDGIVDYGQILDGTLSDDDGDAIPDICEACPGDIAQNGVRDAADLGILLALWGTNGKNNPAADINQDGMINASDLGLLLGYWGPCP
ncbi:MAG: hypothetical protein MK085_00610 [Phycisphaerales bacterium]|nr:hypothetical protein [Phycisphaerales bacterium]